MFLKDLVAWGAEIWVSSSSRLSRESLFICRLWIFIGLLREGTDS